MKIKDILQDKNIDKNENKLALAQVLNLSVPEIVLNKSKELTKKEEKEYKKIKRKLKKGIPVQYALKKAYFYDNYFYINKHVLIPRPETEMLVDETNKLIKKLMNNNVNILDIGTGSGVISITLNKLNKKAKVFATDISKKALKVAEINNKELNTNVTFIKTNLYKNINKKFDVIISNPPYINKKSQNIEKKVKKYEPKKALFAKEEGLYFYEQIIKNIDKIINKKHIIAFEIGENEENKIESMLKAKLPNDKIVIKKDNNGFNRYIFSINE